jgi:hypothetical protein
VKLVERIGETRNIIELHETNGSKASSGKIVNLQDLLLDSYKQDLIGLASKIQRGDVSALKQAGELVKKIHLSQLIKGRGGDFNAITNKDFGVVGSVLKKQYYAGKGDDGKPYGLRHLFKEASEGKVSDKQLAHRLSMYADSGKLSFSNGELESRKETGYKSKKRILGVAEHCPDCVRYASFGWIGIDDNSLPPITVACQCGVNCKCSFEYSRDIKY